MLPIVINVLQVILVLVSLLIILLVLMQRPKNEGLGAAFGGGMTDNLFGAQTTNVLQTITRWLGALFFALTLGLSILYVKQGVGRSTIQEKLSAKTEIPAPATPVPAPVPVPADGTAPPLDGKEPIKLELAPPNPDAGVTPPVFGGEKMPEKPAPAPGAETPAPAPPPAAPPAENKPAEPAPEPKPPEPPK